MEDSIIPVLDLCRLTRSLKEPRRDYPEIVSAPAPTKTDEVEVVTRLEVFRSEGWLIFSEFYLDFLVVSPTYVNQAIHAQVYHGKVDLMTAIQQFADNDQFALLTLYD